MKPTRWFIISKVPVGPRRGFQLRLTIYTQSLRSWRKQFERR